MRSCYLPFYTLQIVNSMPPIGLDFFVDNVNAHRKNFNPSLYSDNAKEHVREVKDSHRFSTAVESDDLRSEKLNAKIIIVDSRT